MEWEIKIRDENGVGLDLIQHEELIMPMTFQDLEPEKRLRMIREFKYMKGDILLCSYPKTCTHWLSNLVNCLTIPGPVGSMKAVSVKLMDTIPFDQWMEVENRRILSSHLMINRLPVEHLKQGGHIIIITRDPRDAMVSYRHHAQHLDMVNGPNLSWKYFIDTWINGKLPFGSSFDYYNSWEKAIKENKDLNVLIVHYEDLKTNGSKNSRLHWR
ncbi:sulfotransferase 6B1-like [Mercenaria mercenaria]|uniref:sulfotransferase 6B1-like n=1 Tax=Mercenaria mercenaria TaxID=6596 RepID=UPI00234E4FE1|nr:sulfotransferase 6B1-like [Mercenaria mercenaria]XP_053404364.1 sulfotransferase 6B1-like [Mercenaria mercenaria]